MLGSLCTREKLYVLHVVSPEADWYHVNKLQAHPIHLWDACTGELRCTYRAFDDNDEVKLQRPICSCKSIAAMTS